MSRYNKEQGLLLIPADVNPMVWTGRRRLETPERPAMLGKMVPIYDHNTSKHPDRIRVSFDDGSTVVYAVEVEQPQPLVMESINNQPMRRRRKP